MKKEMKMGWIAVDFDGTLAKYEAFGDGSVLGEPIPLMLERVKKWLAEGRDVRIFTARVGRSGLTNPNGTVDNYPFAEWQEDLIAAWCLTYIGKTLPITATKDLEMLELWDDRAVQVELNTGKIIGYSRRGTA